MPLNTVINKVGHFRRVNSCFLCSRSGAHLGAPEISPKKTKRTAPQKESFVVGRKGHVDEINTFFDEKPNLSRYKRFLPSKILNVKAYKNPQYLYLICPDTAKKIAEQILKRLKGQNQIIGESNPGLGLISQFLLQMGVPFVKLFELNTDFHDYLKKVFRRQGAFTLYKNDFFNLWRYAYVDKIDRGQRITNLLEGVPIKSWTDDPVMTVIGTITKKTFLIHLVKSIVLQSDIATYGRLDLFLITYEKIWKTFTATKKDSSRLYKGSTILLQVFLETELIEKYPRKYFLPWQTHKKAANAHSPDPDNLYLIRVSMKKDLPFHADQFVPFYCFATSLFGLGKTSVVATCEKWVPGSGENLLDPKLTHDDYMEDFDIFTKFGDLTPTQVVSVFRELTAHPNYPNSPFLDMIDQEWLRTETIDTATNELHKEIPLKTSNK